MDLSPRSLARSLPWFAAALAVESIISLTPPFTGVDLEFFTCLRALMHVPHVALLLGFALGMMVMTWGGASRESCRRLLIGGFVAIGATALAQFMDIGVDRDTSRHWLWLQVLANLLVSVAAPGLWGTALARAQDLQDDRLPRAGRTFGRIALGGLTLYFVADLATVIGEEPSDAWKGVSALLLMSTMILLLARGSLLWAAVESCRTYHEEVTSRVRLGMIQGLMFGWLVGSSLAWSVRMVVHPSNARMLIWHMIVQGTLLLTVTVLTSMALEKPEKAYEPRQKGPYFPEPPPPADTRPIDVD